MAELNLGSLSIQILANTESLNRAIPSIDKLERTVNKLAASIDKMTAAMDKGYTKAANSVVKGNERITSSSKMVVKEFKNTDSAVFRAKENLKKMEANLNHLADKDKIMVKLSSATTRYETTLRRSNLTVKQAAKAQRRYQTKVNEVKNSLIKSGTPMTGWQAKMQSLNKSVVLALGPLSGFSARLTALTAIFNKNTFMLAAAFGGLTAFTVLLFKAMKAGALYEQQMLSMGATLKAFGNQTNLTVQDLDKIAVALAETTLTSTAFAREAAAALVTYKGVTADAVKPTLHLAQSMSQVFGGSILDNVKKLGRVYSDPIRGVEGLGRAGESYTKIQKEQMQVLVDTGQRMKVVDQIMTNLSKRMGGVGVEAAKGLSGAYDTLGERFTHFLEQVGGAPGTLTPFAAAITSVSDSLKRYTDDTAFAQQVSKVMGNIVVFLAESIAFLAKNFEWIATIISTMVVKKALFALIASLKTSGIGMGLLALSTGKATTAMKLFNSTIKKNPLGFLASVGVTAFTALSIHSTLFGDKIDENVESVKKLNAELDKVNKVEMAQDLTANLEDQLKKHRVILEKAEKDAIKLAVNYDLSSADFPVEQLIRQEQSVIDALEKQLAKMYTNVAVEAAKGQALLDHTAMAEALEKLSKKYIKLTSSLKLYNRELNIIQTNTTAFAKMSDRELSVFANKLGYTAQEFRTMMSDLERSALAKNPIDKLIRDIDKFQFKMSTPRSQLISFDIGGLGALNKYNEALKTNADIIKYTNSLRGAESTEVLVRAWKAGIPIVDEATGNYKEMSVIIQDLINKYSQLSAKSREDVWQLEGAKRATVKWKEVGSAMMSSMVDAAKAQQQAFEQASANYEQLASDALEYGRSTANFYMDLADTVRYSNNLQAQSFEDKAMAAAKSAASEYEANKKLQAQADAMAKKQFENAKKLQMAQVVMSTAGAIMQAWAVNPAVGAAMTAPITALGAIQLAAVAGQSFTPRERGGPMTAGQPYLVGEAGPELIVPNKSGTVVNNNGLGNLGLGGSGETVVNFNITTNDSTGFEEMLVRSRGTITNIIRGAQNEGMGTF